MSVEITTIKCPICSSKKIKRYGITKNKFQNFQRYSCKSCEKTFTLQPQIKNKTYPIKIILNTISNYNLGYTQTETSKIIAKKHKIKVPQKTISNWINQHKQACAFSKLRPEAIKLYSPNNIIFNQALQHNQVYIFQYHKAKLYLLFHNIKYNNEFINQSKYYEPIKSYLEKIPTKAFPHHIFKSYETKVKEGIIKTSPDVENNNLKINNQEQRASQIKLEILPIIKLQKNNFACKLAGLALQTAKSNKDRHQSIQNFMLTNDSTTIAVELPVYLTQDDITYYKRRRFLINFLEKYTTPITGHIDFLQIRNGLLHILDYKPDAHLKQTQQQAVQQLTIYALALASRTKLDLHSFKCAFFDENNYYEFFPLHAVYKKR